ncbi:hypothetical protein KQH29_00070 [bacterium]|nr:hypothetical protein [bacterium]
MMTKDEAEQIARILSQYHDAFSFLASSWMPSNRSKTVATVLNSLGQEGNSSLSAFGFAAIAFIFSHDCVAKPLGCTLLTPRNLLTLGVTQNDLGTGETQDISCLRHLRNCFAHGRFRLELKRTILWVAMADYRQNGTQTFAAYCKAEQVLRLSERLLIKAHKIVAAKAK